MTKAALSYVVATERYLTIRRLVEALCEQTARNEVELVVVAPNGSAADLAQIPAGEFAAVKVVERGSIWPMSTARAAGIRASTAPIVFLGETHSFPAPGFARAVIDAGAESWDALIPGLENANPVNAISCSNFVMDYGSWHSSLPGGRIAGGPTWNAAYRLPVLREMDAILDTALDHSDEFWVAFQAARRTTVFAPAARITHANLSQLRWWFEQRYLAGLLVGNSRRRRWGVAKRVLYTVASPLIPLVLMTRLRHAVAASLRHDRRLSLLPGLAAGAIFRTMGEVVGYTVGASADSQPRMDEYELHKLDFTGMTY